MVPAATAAAATARRSGSSRGLPQAVGHQNTVSAPAAATVTRQALPGPLYVFRLGVRSGPPPMAVPGSCFPAAVGEASLLQPAIVSSAGGAAAGGARNALRVCSRVGSGGSLKAPVGLSRCTIVEDAPFPPPNTQVVMELHERTLRVGGRRLRYRGYRPADRALPPPLPPLLSLGPEAGEMLATLAPWGDKQPQQLPAAAAERDAGADLPAGAIVSRPHLRAQPWPHLPGSHTAQQLAPSARHCHYPAAAASPQHLQSNAPHPQPHHPQHLSLSVKVPWAEPSAMPCSGGGGGLLESLNEALASGSGCLVVGAAVRPGCILLQLDLAPAASADSYGALLRGIGAATAAGGRGAGRCRGAAAANGDGAIDGGALAAELVRHVGIMAPQLPDGSEVLVSVGGRVSYSFSYDARTAEWSAVQLGWPAAAGAPAALLLRRLMQGPSSLRLHPHPPAAVAPPPPTARTEVHAAVATPLPPPMLLLSLRLEVPDAAAAAMLAEQLRPLLLAAPPALQALPAQPRHGAMDGWQFVANCLGRSLPVSVLQVAGPNCSPGAGEVRARGSVLAPAIPAYGSYDIAGANAAIAGGDFADGGGIAGNAAATLFVEIGVMGSREALEAMSCRLAVLSVELWYGIQEVARVPIALIHESVALRPPGDGSYPHGGGGVAAAMVAELCELAAAAAEEGATEDGLGVRQIFADLGMLEMYVVSQVRGAACAPVVQDEPAEGGGAGGGSWLRANASSLALSWSSDTAADVPAVFTRSSAEQSSCSSVEWQGAGEEATGPPPSLVLPGSIDLSTQLQQLLGGDDVRRRQSMLLVGAILLSYTVLHALPYTANAVREALAALGCGLFEADELSAAAAGATEDDAVGGEPAADDPRVAEGGAGGEQRQSTRGPEEYGERGLPLVHLAVLSGSVHVVQMVLRWAAGEGLGADWVLRPHRGRSPLQLAAAVAAEARADDNGGGAERTDYLAHVKRLLKLCDDVSSDQVPYSERSPPGAAAAPWPPPTPPLLPTPPPSTLSAIEAGAKASPYNAQQPVPYTGLDGLYGVGCRAGRAAVCGATFPSCAAGGDSPPPSRCLGGDGGGGRNLLLVCLLGYADPAMEARYQRFALAYDAQVASYWIPLMCCFLASALVRPLRGYGGGYSADLAEIPAALLFAWPYVLLAGALLLRPSLVHARLPRWWLLCGCARLSTKWPLTAWGLLRPPASMLSYTRSWVSMLPGVLLPGLCERIPGLPGLVVRLADAAAHCRFLLVSGLAPNLVAAALHSLLRAAVVLGAAAAVEWHHRARFKAAAEAAAAAAPLRRQRCRAAMGRLRWQLAEGARAFRLRATKCLVGEDRTVFADMRVKHVYG